MKKAKGMALMFGWWVMLAAPAGLALTSAQQTLLRQAIAKVAPNMTINSFAPTPVPGWVQASSDNDVFYLSEDSKYLFYGSLFDLSAEAGFKDLTEGYRRQKRAAILQTLDPSEYITYQAKHQPVKTVLTIFMDVDCGYCQKFHQDVAELNRQGVEVRYLAYPRQGPGSSGYKKAESIWCGGSPKQMLQQAALGGHIPRHSCSTNKVADQLALGQRMGVTGTPTIVFENGRMIPGYLPVHRLLQAIEDDQ